MFKRSQLVSLAATAKQTRMLDIPLRYNPFVRFAVLRRIRQGESGDIEARRRLSGTLTARIVEAARNTPYGRQFGRHIEDWPILRKAQLRRDPAQFVARQWISFPASTGGTTGAPIRLVRSAECIAAEQVFLDNMLQHTGLTWRTARVASLRGEAVKPATDGSPPFGRESLGGMRLSLSTTHLNAETIGWYYERLKAFRPQLLWAYPTFAAVLVKLLAERQLALDIPVVLCSSERLSEDAMRLLATSFKAHVVDYYGQAERACLSVAQAPNRHVFNPAYGRVELLPAESVEGGPGWRPMAIVATGFWNRAMPLIRYETGDYAMVPHDATEEELEAIALGLAPFRGIAGRAEEFVYGRDGARLAALNHIPREIDGLLQIQIVQETLDSITIRALASAGFGAAQQVQLAANARAKIPSPAEIRIETVDRLETLPNGKTPFVIRRIEEP